MYKSLSEEGISQAIIGRFNFAIELVNEIVEVVWNSNGAAEPATSLASQERKEFIHILTKHRKVRRFRSMPEMADDEVAIKLNSEPTWQELRATEVFLEDIEAHGYQVVKKEPAK